MIDQRTTESLILTNTIVAAFCIILLVTFTAFVILFLVPSLRRRWLASPDKDENTLTDVSSFSRQLSVGTSRYNPIFESVAGTTAAQFGTVFHPHATTATLLHPTVWTSIVTPPAQQPAKKT